MKREQALQAVLTACCFCLLATRLPAEEQAASNKSRPIPIDPARAHTATSLQAVDLDVEVSYSQNSQTGVYTYTYTVTNLPSSSNVLDIFGIRQTPPPIGISSPPGWHGFRGWDGEPDALVWYVVDPGPPPPGWRLNQTYSGPYNTAPGEVVTGFQITSLQPPVTVEYYAQAFDTIPGGGHSGVSTPAPLLWDSGVTGATMGPDISGTVDVPNGLDPDVENRVGVPVPNPMSTSASIALTLSRASRTEIHIYDVSGRRVRSLLDEVLEPGITVVVWDGEDSKGSRVSSGVYFYQVLLDGTPMGSRRVIVLP